MIIYIQRYYIGYPECKYFGEKITGFLLIYGDSAKNSPHFLILKLQIPYIKILVTKNAAMEYIKKYMKMAIVSKLELLYISS